MSLSPNAALGIPATGFVKPQVSMVRADAGALALTATQTVAGGYIAAGTGMRNRGYGSIAISGIPTGSHVTAAYLVWDVLDDTQSPGTASGSLDGTALSGVRIGSGPSPCWPTAYNFSYFADVTSLVRGNGSYNLSNFASGATDGSDPWVSGSPAPETEGASLVVIYANSSQPVQTIQLFTGAQETSGNSLTATMGGFTSDAAHAGTSTYIVADGQNAGSDGTFDGNDLSHAFSGNDPIIGGPMSYGSLWDTYTIDVGQYLHAGDTSASASITGEGDCLVWVGQVLATTGSAGPATSINYVALGDSYSSGEGTFDYDNNPVGSTCHRGPLAWPRLLQQESIDISKITHNACSGAVTGDLLPPGVGNSKQPIQIPTTPDPSVQLVTITIGGNDVGFVGILTSCYVTFSSCANVAGSANFLAKLSRLKKTLDQVVYPALESAYPNALIVHVGYPRLTPKPGITPYKCGWLSPPEQQAGVDLARELNDTISSAVAVANDPRVEYADVTNALNGHELCTQNSWMNPIGPFGGSERGHPTPAGQQAYEQAVAADLGISNAPTF